MIASSMLIKAMAFLPLLAVSSAYYYDDQPILARDIYDIENALYARSFDDYDDWLVAREEPEEFILQGRDSLYLVRRTSPEDLQRHNKETKDSEKYAKQQQGKYRQDSNRENLKEWQQADSQAKANREALEKAKKSAGSAPRRH